MKHPSCFLIVGVMLAGAALVRGQDDPTWTDHLHLTASGTAAWVNNISRTSFAPTRQDSATYEFSLSNSTPRQLTPSVLLIASAMIDTLTVQEYDLADNFRLGGTLTLQKKFGLGPLAPVMQFNAGTGFKAARLDADRGWATEAGVQLAKRLLPSLRVAAGAQWFEHNAKSATFDLNQHTYFIEASWDINDRWSVAGSASRLEGDIVANAAWSIWGQALGGVFGPDVKNYYTARPWSVTNTYGPGWVAYNVEAEVDLWSLSASYALTDRTAVTLRKSAAYVVNKLAIAYPTDSWGLSLTHRF